MVDPELSLGSSAMYARVSSANGPPGVMLVLSDNGRRYIADFSLMRYFAEGKCQSVQPQS